MSVPNVGRTHYRSGGTRGGRDQFNWEDVKTETYRENYIGHSLKAPVGLHYKKKDHLWWTKGNDPSPLAQVGSEGDGTRDKKRKKQKKEKKKHKKGKKKRSSRRRSESEDSKASADNHAKEALKKHDEELMAQALGLSSKQETDSGVQKLNTRDMKVLLARGNEDFERTETDGERIKGLGAGFSKKHDLVDPSVTQRGGEATYFLEGDDASDTKKDTRRKEQTEEGEKAKKKKHKRKRKKKRRRHDSSSESEDEEERRLKKLLKKNQNKLY